jgi:hypothetical protein
MLRSKGIHNVAPIDWNTDQHLYEGKGLNVKPSDLQDPVKLRALNSAFMKVMGPDGKWKLASTENLVKSTGTTSYLSTPDRVGMEKRFNKLGEILKGHISTPEEEEYTAAALSSKTAKAKAAEAEATLKLDDLHRWQESNPNGTMSEYLSSLAVQKPLSAKDQAKAAKEEAAAQAAKSEKPFIDSLKSLGSKEYTPEVYQRAKELEAANKKAGISLPNEYLKGIYQNADSAKEFLSLRKKISSIPRNALEKVKKDFSNLFGLTSTLAGTPEEKAAQLKTQIAKLRFETELGLGVAKYVKMMSGAAVTEEEFNRYNVFSQAGSWSDISAATEAIGAFSDSLQGTLASQFENIRVKNPWTYMNRKTDMESYEASLTPAPRTRPRASNPFRDKPRRPLSDFGGK